MFYTGCKGAGESSKDLLFGSDVSIYLAERQNFDYQPQFEYNQAERYETRNWCPIYSCISMLSYLFNKEICRDFIEKVGHKMIEDGKLDPDEGAYLHDAVDYVRKEWNKSNPNQKIMSFQINYSDKKQLELLSKTIRLTQLGYRTSTELYNELQSKGYAEKKDYPKGGGHAVARYGLNIIDNYKGKMKKNRYSFEYFDDLVKNKVIMKFGYIFLKV